MSIIGIGIDMISIMRFKKLIFRYGTAIPKKILSKNELYEYKNIHNKERYLAKNFTAKEAAAKAIGLGIYKHMFLKNCEVIYDIYGKPKINMLGCIRDKFKKLQVKKIFLSITNTHKYTQSIVILEN
ncbi:Holo-[acyl-carrier-protein] synthase [Buchnera aphidicola (Cinara kochiana kochiana)]|uniref:Holo-[acyl-carrier-protein] synthase n=1 Tax=Buchnera aphidicola (Cinara kochiana kochiana) TaxID=2518976 RepID=A0A451D5J5_9GAMM|nr:holo-ACP synthase [Buchnera aphidicola]VFP81082.1 Holo-[acyl-carrier-protein] synthase [Buchnera aphidicola (Cinara kochiana kochiana)]